MASRYQDSSVGGAVKPKGRTGKKLTLRKINRIQMVERLREGYRAREPAGGDYTGPFLPSGGAVGFSKGKLVCTLGGLRSSDVLLDVRKALHVRGMIVLDKGLNKIEDVRDLGLKGILPIPEEEDLPMILLGDMEESERPSDLRINGKYLRASTICGCCGSRSRPNACSKCRQKMILRDGTDVVMPTHEIGSNVWRPGVIPGVKIAVQIGHVLGEINRQHGWHACERVQNGKGEMQRKWACNTHSDLASYMWLMHQHVGARDNSRCSHQSWDSGSTTKSFTAEPDELARGVLRNTEPHFGFRCPACAAFAQHGWKYDAVSHAIQPIACPNDYRAPFLCFIDRMKAVLEQMGDKVYVTASSRRYEKLEQSRAMGLEGFLPYEEVLVLVPEGEPEDLWTPTCFSQHCKRVRVLHMPKGVPERATASIRLLAFYAARAGQNILIGNRFVTVDHAWSIGAVASALESRQGSIVSAITYSASYANLAATGALNPCLKMSKRQFIDSILTTGAVYGHDEIILPELGNLVAVHDIESPVTAFVRLRKAKSPYLSEIKLAARDILGVQPAANDIVSEVSIGLVDTVRSLRPRIQKASGRMIYVVCKKDDLDVAAVKWLEVQEKKSGVVWVDPKVPHPKLYAHALGMKYTDILVWDEDVKAQRRDKRKTWEDRLCRLAGVVSATEETVSIKRRTFRRRTLLSRVLTFLPAELYNAPRLVSDAVFGAMWVLTATLISGNRGWLPHPAMHEGIAPFLGLSGRPSVFAWTVAAMYIQLKLNSQVKSSSLSSLAAAVGVEAKNRFFNSWVVACTWVTGDYDLGRSMAFILRLAVLSYSVLHCEEAEEDIVPKGKGIEFQVVRLKELLGYGQNVWYALHPRIYKGDVMYEGSFLTQTYGGNLPFITKWKPWTVPHHRCFRAEVCAAFETPDSGATLPIIYGPLQNCMTAAMPIVYRQSHYMGAKGHLMMLIQTVPLTAFSLVALVYSIADGIGKQFARPLKMRFLSWRNWIATGRQGLMPMPNWLMGIGVDAPTIIPPNAEVFADAVAETPGQERDVMQYSRWPIAHEGANCDTWPIPLACLRTFDACNCGNELRKETRVPGFDLRYPDQNPEARCLGCSGRGHQGLLPCVYASLISMPARSHHPLVPIFEVALGELNRICNGLMPGARVLVTSDFGNWLAENPKRGPEAKDWYPWDHVIFFSDKGNEEVRPGMDYIKVSHHSFKKRHANIIRRLGHLIDNKEVTVVVMNARVEPTFDDVDLNELLLHCTEGRIWSGSKVLVTPAPGGLSISKGTFKTVISKTRMLSWMATKGHIYGADDLGTSYHFPCGFVDLSPERPKSGQHAYRRKIAYATDFLYKSGGRIYSKCGLFTMKMAADSLTYRQGERIIRVLPGHAPYAALLLSSLQRDQVLQVALTDDDDGYSAVSLVDKLLDVSTGAAVPACRTLLSLAGEKAVTEEKKTRVHKMIEQYVTRVLIPVAAMVGQAGTMGTFSATRLATLMTPTIFGRVCILTFYVAFGATEEWNLVNQGVKGFMTRCFRPKAQNAFILLTLMYGQGLYLGVQHYMVFVAALNIFLPGLILVLLHARQRRELPESRANRLIYETPLHIEATIKDRMLQTSGTFVLWKTMVETPVNIGFCWEVLSKAGLRKPQEQLPRLCLLILAVVSVIIYSTPLWLFTTLNIIVIWLPYTTVSIKSLVIMACLQLNKQIASAAGEALARTAKRAMRNATEGDLQAIESTVKSIVSSARTSVGAIKKARLSLKDALHAYKATSDVEELKERLCKLLDARERQIDDAVASEKIDYSTRGKEMPGSAAHIERVLGRIIRRSKAPEVQLERFLHWLQGRLEEVYPGDELARMLESQNREGIVAYLEQHGKNITPAALDAISARLSYLRGELSEEDYKHPLGKISVYQWASVVNYVDLPATGTAPTRDVYCCPLPGQVCCELGKLYSRNVAAGIDGEASLTAALTIWSEQLKTPTLASTIAMKDVDNLERQPLGWKMARALRRVMERNTVIEGIGRPVVWVLLILAQTARGFIRVGLDILARMPETVPGKWLTETAHTILDLLNVSPRDKAKSVWVPLKKLKALTMTKEEELALLIGSQLQPITPGTDTKDAVLDALKRAGLKEGLDTSDLVMYSSRRTYLPKRVRAAAHERPQILKRKPDVKFLEDKVVDARARAIARSHKLGVDGTWWADDDMVRKSLDRYKIQPHKATAAARELAYEAVDALIDRYPELATPRGVLDPAKLINYIEKRYSPGWPFIPTYKSRAELWDSGWGRAIETAATEFLKAGVYPDVHWHAFPKMQVVSLDALEGGKDVRTVVAQDLTTSFIDHSLLLEGTKGRSNVVKEQVLAAPLTEAGLKNHFAAVKERRLAVNFDARAHDSKMAPILFEATAELNAKAFDWANNPNIRNMIHARYARIQTGVIHNLQTGEVTQKQAGGGTGQSRTTGDNTDGLQIGIMAAWSAVTGKPVKSFWDNCTLRLHSDNGMLGWDDPDFDFGHFSTVLESLYGVDLTYDMVDESTAMEFLSRKAVDSSDHARDYETLKRSLPDFAVIQDPNTIMMRRSGMTARLAAAPSEQHLRGRIMRTVGHSQLAAHQRGLFDTLARDYLEDAALLLEVETLPARIITDADGLITDIIWHAPKDDDPPSYRNRLNWLNKAGRILSYDRILEAQIEGSETSKALPKSKRKIAKLKYVDGKAVLMTRCIENVSDVIKAACPSYIHRMWADNSSPPIYEPSYTGDYRIERWIHAMLSKELEEYPEDKDIEEACRMSPLSGTLDPPGFLDWRETEEGKVQVMQDTPENTGGYVLLVMGVYIVINSSAVLFGRGSWIGPIMRLYFFINSDMAKLYSMANLMYYLGTARSSVHISALMPRDPYHGTKKLAVLIASILPEWASKLLPWSQVVSWWPGLVELIARYHVHKDGTHLSRTTLLAPYPKIWHKTANEIIAHFKAPVPYGYLSAPTSSGKSTMFVAAIQEITKRQVVLVVPTRLLRDTYNNPYVSFNPHILEEGGQYSSLPKIVVMTYGQLLARRQQVEKSQPVFLLDETHLGNPEMIELYRLLKRQDKVMLSATERKDIFPDAGPSYYPNIKRRGVVTMIPSKGNTETLMTRALGMLSAGERMAVMVVGTTEAENLASSLIKGGYAAQAVTAKRRKIMPVGHIIGTSVIYTGMNLEPQPRIAVTSGRELAAIRGEKRIQATCASTHIQQAGRVGRRGAGYFIYPPEAGSGAPLLPYPNWMLFTSSDACKENFERVYGIKIDLGRKTTGTIGKGADTTCISTNTGADRNTLIHLYRFLVCTDSAAQAVQAYVVWKTSGVFMKGFEQARDSIAAGKARPPFDLSQSAILHILNSRPYQTSINGKDVRHRGLKLLGNTAVSL